jgi:hypothetical protein
MKQHLRAEDFSVDSARIDLGGRILAGSAVVTVHRDKRVSAELLVMLFLAAITGMLIPFSREPILFVVILGVFVLGIARELQRSWVLVLNLYQLGGFEVRGFTQPESLAALELVDDLRRGCQGGPGGRGY